MEICLVIQDMHILKVMKFCRRVCVCVMCLCKCGHTYLCVQIKIRMQLSLVDSLLPPLGPGMNSVPRPLRDGASTLWSISVALDSLLESYYPQWGLKQRIEAFFVLYFFQLKIIFDAVNKFSLRGFYSFLSKVWDCFYYQYAPLLSEIDFMFSSIEIKHCHCEEWTNEPIFTSSGEYWKTSQEGAKEKKKEPACLCLLSQPEIFQIKAC